MCPQIPLISQFIKNTSDVPTFCICGLFFFFNLELALLLATTLFSLARAGTAGVVGPYVTARTQAPCTRPVHVCAHTDAQLWTMGM